MGAGGRFGRFPLLKSIKCYAAIWSLKEVFSIYDKRAASCGHCCLSLTLDPPSSNWINRQNSHSGTAMLTSQQRQCPGLRGAAQSGRCMNGMKHSSSEQMREATGPTQDTSSLLAGDGGTHPMTAASGSSRSERSGQLSVRGTCCGSHTWGGKKQQLTGTALRVRAEGRWPF